MAAIEITTDISFHGRVWLRGTRLTAQQERKDPRLVRRFLNKGHFKDVGGEPAADLSEQKWMSLADYAAKVNGDKPKTPPATPAPDAAPRCNVVNSTKRVEEKDYLVELECGHYTEASPHKGAAPKTAKCPTCFDEMEVSRLAAETREASGTVPRETA